MPKPGSPLHNIPTKQLLPVTPKYKEKEKIGHLTITQYLGHTYGTNLYKSHSYLTFCECGQERIVSQNYLNSKKTLKLCVKCSEEHVRNTKKKKRKRTSANKLDIKATRDVLTLKWC